MSRLSPALFRTVRRVLHLPLLAGTALVAACSDSSAPDIPSNPAVEVYAAALGVNIAAMTRKSDNLYVQDVVVGTGADAVVGKTLRMTYSGYLINGSKFDSNVGGTPFSFTLGVGQVITGWDLGIQGMKAGGKRKLVIGSALGYRNTGSGPIPGNATLVFDVELLSVQ
jgi:FKBP-type peptidyl-prolyl cis-trans isomerase